MGTRVVKQALIMALIFMHCFIFFTGEKFNMCIWAQFNVFFSEYLIFMNTLSKKISSRSKFVENRISKNNKTIMFAILS